jgi:hypothetical protein
MERQTQQIVWAPNPGPQVALIECPIEEVFYGGARGGGKTEGSIGDWLQHSSTYGSAAIGVFFRRTHKQLDEVIARTKELFTPLGAKYFELPKSEWIMPNGARLKFRYIEKDKDAEEYQGHSYTRVYVEELTNFPSPGPINKLRATLRSGTGVPCCLRLTGNPGGPGHQWVKKRYIDPAPRGGKILTESFPHPITGRLIVRERIFIPSKVTDNPRASDAYIGNLYQSAQGNPDLLKAWLDGNWDIVQGAFFECWNPLIHVVPADVFRYIPGGVSRFRAFDWGSYRPFSCGWYAVGDGKWGYPGKRPFPVGAFIKYREWYGTAGEPNVGLKLSPESVARGIISRQSLYHEQVEYGVADPSIFVRDGGPSIMEIMAREGLFWRKADNKRIPGWVEMRHRLLGGGWADEMLVPMLYFAECCEDSIRTIPTLQHKEDDPEDIDTESEDHAADETRYACMARPIYAEAATEGVQGYPSLSTAPAYTIMELVERQSERRRAEAY